MSQERVTARTQLPPSATGRWYALAVLATGLLLAMTTWFSATAVLPQLTNEWDLSTLERSLLTIAVQCGFVVGAVLSATFNLADVISARRLMLLGASGAAAANLLLLTAPGAESAIVWRTVTGACLACVYPPGLKAIATWFVRGRGTATGVMVGALTLGSAAPHLVNSVGGAQWHTVIVLTSALTVAGGLLVEFGVRDGPYPFPVAVVDPRQITIVWRNRGVRLATLGYLGHMWELYAMWAWIFPFFLAQQDSGVSDSQAALLAFAAIAVGGLGCWVGGRLGDTWGRTKLTTLAMVLSGCCCLLIGPVTQTNLALTIAIALFWGFWVIADSGQFASIITEVADRSYVGTALTVQLAIGFMLSSVTIWLIPEVQAIVGWEWAFVVLAPGPFLGTWAMLRLRRRPEARQIAGGLG